jgi:hypothetical protein
VYEPEPPVATVPAIGVGVVLLQMVWAFVMVPAFIIDLTSIVMVFEVAWPQDADVTVLL